LGCGQPSKPVDSITDPRFAAEFAYARQIWLHSLKAQEAAIKLELPRLSAGVEPGWILQERKPTDLDRFVTEVTHLYHRGVAALASPHPGVVDVAYACFHEVARAYSARMTVPESDRCRKEVPIAEDARAPCIKRRGHTDPCSPWWTP